MSNEETHICFDEESYVYSNDPAIDTDIVVSYKCNVCGEEKISHAMHITSESKEQFRICLDCLIYTLKSVGKTKAQYEEEHSQNKE